MLNEPIRFEEIEIFVISIDIITTPVTKALIIQQVGLLTYTFKALGRFSFVRSDQSALK